MTQQIIQGDVMQVLGGMEPGGFNCILADPPFNLGKDYGAGIDDKLPAAEYEAWLLDFYQACYRTANEDAVLYGFCSGDQIPLARRCIETTWSYCQQLFWYGPNGPAWGRSKHGKKIWAPMAEPLVYATKGKGLAGAAYMPWYHTVLPIVRPQSNQRAGRWGPCQKPVKLYKLLLQAHQGITRVLDPTVGTGSSLVACAELGLDAVGIELNPDTAELARGRVRAAQQGLRYRLARQGQAGLW